MPQYNDEVNCIVSNDGCELYIETNDRVYSVVILRPLWNVEYRLNNSKVETLPNTPKVKILLAKFEQARPHMISIVHSNRMDEINRYYVDIQNILKG